VIANARLIASLLAAGLVAGCHAAASSSAGGSHRPGTAATGGDYEFSGGFPTKETVQRAYDDADFSRAVEAYKFFYPTVSWAAGFLVLEPAGIKTNRMAGLLESDPKQLVFTPNSDTPYAVVPLDLSGGPIVVELPAGALIGAANDLNQRWVMDFGLPGPDKGKGGKHLILPPGWKSDVPQGYFTGTSSTNRLTLAIRAIPDKGDNKAAKELTKTVKIHPLQGSWSVTDWVDLTGRKLDMSCVGYETDLKFWSELHDIIDKEPPFEPYRMMYGELAALGIMKGKPFAPDARMKDILVRAAKAANAQMRVQAFADRTPERVTWKDRQWEWASLRPENGTFDLPGYQDLAARDKWFYQAILESPAMFKRDPTTGSLYWLGLRDRNGDYVDGGKTYKLTVPLPVPAKLFWSVTVYDPDTRAQIATDQGHAALRSIFELKDSKGSSVDLYFGPKAPAGHEGQWIQTIPGKGWFAYFRIYGPDAPAFDGSWKPGDFELVK